MMLQQKIKVYVEFAPKVTISKIESFADIYIFRISLLLGVDSMLNKKKRSLRLRFSIINHLLVVLLLNFPLAYL